jgi:hypothetical protein
VNHNAVNFNILRNCNPNIEKQNSREKAHEPALFLCSVDESPPCFPPVVSSIFKHVSCEIQCICLKRYFVLLETCEIYSFFVSVFKRWLEGNLAVAIERVERANLSLEYLRGEENKTNPCPNVIKTLTNNDQIRTIMINDLLL